MGENSPRQRKAAWIEVCKILRGTLVSEKEKKAGHKNTKALQ